MTVIEIQAGPLSARISTKGGVVLGFWQELGAERLALLRPSPSDETDALGSACYPLVPFGNRIRDNRFSFAGRSYSLKPNTQWDRHYLHGEGWQADWSVLDATAYSVKMSFRHQDGDTPYVYQAIQGFTLDEGGLTVTLAVENQGQRSMPFGIGWHPYFPMTPRTTLFAPARKFWTETEGWLPGEQTEIPEDLDFNAPRALPHRWVNNGFEDWSGEAIIAWPEREAALHVTADAVFKHAFVFVSDTSFDPEFKRDYFCFEPMSHLADGHNMADLGDLKVLAPGECLSGKIDLRPCGI